MSDDVFAGTRCSTTFMERMLLIGATRGAPIMLPWICARRGWLARAGGRHPPDAAPSRRLTASPGIGPLRRA